MKLAIILPLMLSFLPLQAEPLKPMTMKLNSDEIVKIPIHSRVQTLLLFPEPVTLLIGEGITDGQREGRVQAQLAEDKRVVVLRSIAPDATALMQIMVGPEAYAFRLQHDEHPASIIRFGGGQRFPKAKEISVGQAQKNFAFPSQARQHQLIQLAKQAGVLKSQLPDEYQGYQSRDFNEVTWGSGVSCTLKHIARFPQDHSMVVFATITNLSEDLVKSGSLNLKVGGGRSYPLPFSGPKASPLKHGESYSFATLLLGDGSGNPLHLSLENDFELTFNPQKTNK
jgi:hypothetical protein